jgi:hypothetical protein
MSFKEDCYDRVFDFLEGMKERGETQHRGVVNGDRYAEFNDLVKDHCPARLAPEKNATLTSQSIVYSF